MSNVTTQKRDDPIAPDAIHQCLTSRSDSELRNCLSNMLDAMPPGALPLQSCCVQGGIADETERSISLLGHKRMEWGVRIRAGVFFTEIVGGCNCHDDPVRHNVYCVLEIDLHDMDGIVDVAIIND